MPANIVTGPTAMQNLPFLPPWKLKPLSVPVALSYGGMAKLSGSECPGKYHDGRPAKGSHQCQ